MWPRIPPAREQDEHHVVSGGLTILVLGIILGTAIIVFVIGLAHWTLRLF